MALSVSSEHAFSQGGITISKCCNHLKGDIVEALNVSNALFATTYSSVSRDHHLLEKSMMSMKVKQIPMRSWVMMRRMKRVGTHCFWEMIMTRMAENLILMHELYSSRARPKPNHHWRLGPSFHILKVQTTWSKAEAPAFRPSWAGTSLFRTQPAHSASNDIKKEHHVNSNVNAVYTYRVSIHFREEQSVKSLLKSFSASPLSSHSFLHLSLIDSAFRLFFSPSDLYGNWFPVEKLMYYALWKNLCNKIAIYKNVASK